MNKMQLFFIFWLAGLAACTPIPENVTRVKECHERTYVPASYFSGL